MLLSTTCGKPTGSRSPLNRTYNSYKDSRRDVEDVACSEMHSHFLVAAVAVGHTHGRIERTPEDEQYAVRLLEEGEGVLRMRMQQTIVQCMHSFAQDLQLASEKQKV